VGNGADMPALRLLLERLTTALENARVLDPPADWAQRVTGLVGPGRAKDLLSGTPIGHPMHPALVTLPIGAFASAVVLDATGGDPRSARRLVGLGLLSSLPAAATGASDWNETQGAERRVGVVHALTNSAALALLASSWWQRRSGSGRGRSAAGLALLGGSAWLGGHLSYAQGVGVDTTAFAKPPVDWTDACALDELSDRTPFAVTVVDVPVLLLSRPDGLVAMANRCTHRGAPLSDGELVDGCIECPWHASRFDLRTGQVQRGPATRPQPVFEVRVVEGRVQVRRDEQRTLRLNPAS